MHRGSRGSFVPFTAFRVLEDDKLWEGWSFRRSADDWFVLSHSCAEARMNGAPGCGGRTKMSAGEQGHLPTDHPCAVELLLIRLFWKNMPQASENTGIKVTIQHDFAGHRIKRTAYKHGTGSGRNFGITRVQSEDYRLDRGSLQSSVVI